MGGMEGSRGYVYQGLVSVLNAFSVEDWNEIQIEFPTEGDKVDIILFRDSVGVRAIQVKSSINPFSPSMIKTWLRELIADYQCAEYELVLIGQANHPGTCMINAIDKYNRKQLDKGAKQLLADLIPFLETSNVHISQLPFELNALRSTVLDSLFRYISSNGEAFTYTQVELLSNAAIGEHLLLSTNGSSIKRAAFEVQLRERIKALQSDSAVKRIDLCLRSFLRGSMVSSINRENILDLLSYFDGHDLIPKYNWNRDLVPLIEDFFQGLSAGNKYALYLDTHSSLAFFAGRTCDSKSGIDICPYQKTFTAGIRLWHDNDKTRDDYTEWIIEETTLPSVSHDVVLILNGSRIICEDVLHFLEKNNIAAGRVLSCKIMNQEASHSSVFDGYHAAKLAEDISALLDSRSYEEKIAAVHIFSAMPNAFMFYLGKISRLFRHIMLYEYDFKNCSYQQSFELFQ